MRARPESMLQSAMEYLMTYGWAILAIAIVMVSLYSLGIFNTGNLQPTATPGSCEVVRTVAQTSLAGQCSNLIPKYVGQFNGASSSFVYAGTPLPLQVQTVSIAAWVKNPLKSPDACQTVVAYGYDFRLCTSSAKITFNNQGIVQMGQSTGTVAANAWTFVGVSYDASGNYAFYINGQQSGSGTDLQTFSWSGRVFCIGIYDGSSTSCLGLSVTDRMNGSMADVQVYNTSLDSSSFKALYQEGVGGAPIDLQHLIGWWPLNGNANDYSGNNYQGTNGNVIWNADWQNGYAAPTT